MKKKRELTKKEKEANIRFIRKAPARLRKHKKLINGNMTKEDLINLLAALWKNLERVTTKKIKVDFFSGREVEVRKYKNIPAFNHFNKYPRKILVGIYGSTLQLARKEGLV